MSLISLKITREF